MHPLSSSERQVLMALYRCNGPAGRRQIQYKLPVGCRWADSTVLNFLYRLEKKGYVKGEKEGNRNLYRPTLTRGKFLEGEAGEMLEILFDGEVTGLLETLVASGALDLEKLEELRVWLDGQILELGDYDLWE